MTGLHDAGCSSRALRIFPPPDELIDLSIAAPRLRGIALI